MHTIQTDLCVHILYDTSNVTDRVFAYFQNCVRYLTENVREVNKICETCLRGSERFPLPLGAWDGLRNFTGPSI